MASAVSQYEFSDEQNALFDSLAHKMRWVGLFFAAVGVLNLLATALLMAAIYRNHLPADWAGRLPPEVQSQVRDLPPNNQLWGLALNTGVTGLLYLLIGVWTRSAASFFRRIVTTQGQDISYLMHALSALHKLYTLLYTLLLITLLFVFIALGLALYYRMTVI